MMHGSEKAPFPTNDPWGTLETFEENTFTYLATQTDTQTNAFHHHTSNRAE